MSNEVEAIEAILNHRLRLVIAKSGGIERALGIDGVRQAAMEIAALRARDREDGAREMTLPLGWVAVPRHPTKAMKAAAARAVGGSWDFGHEAYAQAIAAAPPSPVPTQERDEAKVERDRFRKICLDKLVQADLALASQEDAPFPDGSYRAAVAMAQDVVRDIIRQIESEPPAHAGAEIIPLSPARTEVGDA